MRVRDRAVSYPTDRRPDSVLRWTAVLFAVGFVVHGADHTVRGLTGNDHHAAWPGALQVVMGALTVLIAATVLFLVFTGRRSAPVVAAVVGLGVAAFFVLVHALPTWGGYTDSFIAADSGARVTAFSWLTASIGTLTAFALGVAGLRATRATFRAGTGAPGDAASAPLR